MLGSLDDTTDVYNNAGALLGLDGENDELVGEVLGALRKMNPLKRQKVINKLTAPPPASKGSRAEMEKHFNELPDHIKAGLQKGELRLADTIIYSVKPLNSKSTKIFETQDVKQQNLRNITGGKLPKNQALLVSGIILLAGVAVDDTPDNVMATAFTGIESVPTLFNGEFSLKANKKQIIPDNSSNYFFRTQGFTSVPVGYFKLANPRIIHDDVLIEMVIELGTQTGIAAHTYVWAGLHGTITTP